MLRHAHFDTRGGKRTFAAVQWLHHEKLKADVELSRPKRIKQSVKLTSLVTHGCHILETSNDNYRFKLGSEIAKQKRKKAPALTKS